MNLTQMRELFDLHFAEIEQLTDEELNSNAAFHIREIMTHLLHLHRDLTLYKEVNG